MVRRLEKTAEFNFCVHVKGRCFSHGRRSNTLFTRSSKHRANVEQM